MRERGREMKKIERDEEREEKRDREREGEICKVEIERGVE